jgi:hypothetical protein
MPAAGTHPQKSKIAKVPGMTRKKTFGFQEKEKVVLPFYSLRFRKNPLMATFEMQW